jgi:hypothetical protein
VIAVRRTAAVLAAAVLAVGLAATIVAVAHPPDRSRVPGTPRMAAAAAPLPVATPSASDGRRPAAVSQVSPAWVATYAGRTVIPPRALQAYADAALRTPCAVGWTTLAGIGWVESGHGTHDGQEIGADGRSLVPILGPVLDGRGRVAAVPDEHGGWARAEGPMQSLPSTWARWGADGDGDGVADPQDLDDAAYSAARYLCAAGQDLRTGAGWSAAIRFYNHSDDYVRAVYDAASAYTERSS